MTLFGEGGGEKKERVSFSSSCAGYVSFSSSSYTQATSSAALALVRHSARTLDARDVTMSHFALIG